MSTFSSVMFNNPKMVPKQAANMNDPKMRTRIKKVKSPLDLASIIALMLEDGKQNMFNNPFSSNKRSMVGSGVKTKINKAAIAIGKLDLLSDIDKNTELTAKLLQRIVKQNSTPKDISLNKADKLTTSNNSSMLTGGNVLSGLIGGILGKLLPTLGIAIAGAVLGGLIGKIANSSSDDLKTIVGDFINKVDEANKRASDYRKSKDIDFSDILNPPQPKQPTVVPNNTEPTITPSDNSLLGKEDRARNQAQKIENEIENRNATSIDNAARRSHTYSPAPNKTEVQPNESESPSFFGRLLEGFQKGADALMKPFNKGKPKKEFDTKKHEGLVLDSNGLNQAFNDLGKGGKKLIGYGHQLTPKEKIEGVIELPDGRKLDWTKGITPEEAEALYRADKDRHSELLMKELQKQGVDTSKIAPDIKDVLDDFAYQMGPYSMNDKKTPNLMKGLRSGDRKVISEAMENMALKTPTGERYRGLETRTLERARLVRDGGDTLGTAIDGMSSAVSSMNRQTSMAAPVIINNNTNGGGNGGIVPGTGGIKSTAGDKFDREPARNMGTNDGWEMARVFNQMYGLA